MIDFAQVVLKSAPKSITLGFLANSVNCEPDYVVLALAGLSDQNVLGSPYTTFH